MKMKRMGFFVFAGCLTLLAAGCKSAAPVNSPAAKTEQSAPAPRKPRLALTPANAKAEGEKIIRAWLTGNYAGFTSCLSPEQQDKLSEKSYRELLQKFDQRLGKAEKVEYFGKMRNGDIDTFVWNVSFVAPAQKDPKKTTRFDLLYRISLRAAGEGKYDVVTLGW